MSPSSKPGLQSAYRFRGASGVWVVTALLAAGVVAGVVTVNYWKAQAQAARGQDGSLLSETPITWDHAKAQEDLDQLQNRFADAVEAGDGDLAPLIADIRDMLKDYPGYAAGHTLLGQVLLKEGQRGTAYEQFTLSLEIDGQQPEVHLLAGTIEYGNGRFDQAAHHYAMAVGLAPQENRYKLHLAQAQIRLQQFSKARRGLLEVIKMDSTSHEAYATLADLYADQNKARMAIDMIGKAVEHTPVVERDKQVAYILRKAQLLRRANQPEDALLVFEKLSPTERLTDAVMAERALCWAMMGRPRDAAQVYEQAWDSAPIRWRWVQEAARWRIKAGDDDAARRHMEDLHRLNPRAEALHELDRLLTKQQETTAKPG